MINENTYIYVHHIYIYLRRFDKEEKTGGFFCLRSSASIRTSRPHKREAQAVGEVTLVNRSIEKAQEVLDDDMVKNRGGANADVAPLERSSKVNDIKQFYT